MTMYVGNGNANPEKLLGARVFRNTFERQDSISLHTPHHYISITRESWNQYSEEAQRTSQLFKRYFSGLSWETVYDIAKNHEDDVRGFEFALQRERIETLGKLAFVVRARDGVFETVCVDRIVKTDGIIRFHTEDNMNGGFWRIDGECHQNPSQQRNELFYEDYIEDMPWEHLHQIARRCEGDIETFVKCLIRYREVKDGI